MKKTLATIILSLITSLTLFGVATDNAAKTIYLCGETHYEDGKDSQFQMDILKLAAENKLVYAMEGLERELQVENEFSMQISAHFQTNKKPCIYGVEDPLFIIFKEALTLHSDFKSLKKRGTQIDAFSQNVYDTKKNDILCPLVHKSNQKFLGKFWANKQLIGNPIFDYLKKHKAALIKKTFQAQTATFKPQIEQWTDNNWIDFNREIVLILEPQVAKQIPTEKLETLEFLVTCVEDFELETDCDARAASQYFLKKLHLNLRNDFIIKNLEDIYSITKSQKKPVVCILGSAHIEGVKKGLEEKRFTVLGKKEFLKTLMKGDL